ncbi:aminotransferase class I/II-fold pyridoxal phosphate-dependent enzyme, partial [Bacteriovoracaceae bacterium]|nr:aminotransferase class I/II-fold pyridoxal phosphate-dependent enzyme [Bacteriovoracaceae bacterium]
HYNMLHGLESLRASFSNFLKRKLNFVEVEADNIVIQSGASSICENLAFVLCDSGEGILIPAPFYTGFSYDFEKRFSAQLIPFQLDPINKFEFNYKAMLTAYDESRIKIKALLITNPNNPTGSLYTKEELLIIIDFCKERDIDLITDDVYALATFSDDEYQCAVNLAGDYAHRVHLIYSMAKDFSLGGFKVGFFYTKNIEIYNAMRDTSYFCTVSTATQYLVNNVLDNLEWITNFLKISKKRLQVAYTCLKDNLNWDIPIIEAGIFVFIDFSQLLKESSQRGELDLFDRFWDDTKINITPGQYFGCSTPGYFRVCFANPEKDILEFCKRVNIFIEKNIQK